MLRQAWDERERNRRTGDSDAAVLVIVENAASGERNPMDYVRERIRALLRKSRSRLSRLMDRKPRTRSRRSNVQATRRDGSSPRT